MNQNQWQGWDSPQTGRFPPVQPSPWPDQPPRRQGMSAGVAAVIAVLVVLALGLLGAVVFLMLRDDSGETSAAPITSTVVATASAQGSAGGQSPASSPAQAAPVVPPAPAPAPASQPSGSYECTNAGSGSFAHSAVGSSVTSCDFAASVRSSYLGSGNRGGAATVTAYSPVTGQYYTMSCSGGAVVTCTGGNNAVVYIY